MVWVAMPMLALLMGVPAVKKRLGNAISTASKKINEVRAKKCLSGTREATAKKRGIKQIISMVVKLKIKRETTIIETTAMSLARGFMSWSRPFRLLKSST
jgi:hypothetical protein